MIAIKSGINSRISGIQNGTFVCTVWSEGISIKTFIDKKKNRNSRRSKIPKIFLEYSQVH